MTIPEVDLVLIRDLCERQVPMALRHQVRVEPRQRGHAVTIVELRPPWATDDDSDWTETPQARLRYDEQTNGWTLFWFDQRSRAHAYDRIGPHQPIQRLLTEYDADPTGIFKG